MSSHSRGFAKNMLFPSVFYFKAASVFYLSDMSCFYFTLGCHKHLFLSVTSFKIHTDCSRLRKDVFFMTLSHYCIDIIAWIFIWFYLLATLQLSVLVHPSCPCREALGFISIYIWDHHWLSSLTNPHSHCWSQRLTLFLTFAAVLHIWISSQACVDFLRGGE